MSEASSSSHFWHASVDAVRRLATSQAVASRIVASNETWTCLVPFDAEDAHRLAKAASEPVLLWSYYEDYALNLEFVDAGRPCGAVSLIWQPGLAPVAQASIPADLVSHLVMRGVLSPDGAAQLDALARDVATCEISGEEVRDRAAAIFALAAYEWLSPETCLEVSLENFRQDYPAAEDIEVA